MQLSGEDPFLQGHSKLYQRRKEIEAELRREFNIPEEEVMMEMMQGRPQGPLLFGRPPPVPKPRRNYNHLPKIPRVLSEPPRTRWGNIEPPEDFHRPRTAQETEEQRFSPEPAASVQPPQLPATFSPRPPPGMPPMRGADWQSFPDQMSGPDRPHSWRQFSAESAAAAQLGPAARSPSTATQASSSKSPPCPAPRVPRTPRVHRVDRLPVNPPHMEKARELEELAREYQQKNKAREEEEKRVAAEREAFLAKERRAEEEERERRQRLAEEKVQETKRQEEKRFEELREKELRRRQREAEEAESRRNEQEDWEREIRRRFDDEKSQRKQHHEDDMAEIEKQEQIKAKLEKERAARIQQECERQDNRAREREDDRERWRKQLEEETERHRVAAAAFAEAEKLKRNAGFGSHRSSPSMPSPQMGRGRPTFHQDFPGASAPPPKASSPWGRPEAKAPSSSRPDAPNSSPGPSTYQERSGGAGPSAPPRGSSEHRSSSVPAAPAPSASVPADEVLRQAELSAMQQLNAVRRLSTKEERQRAFKDLLRNWHPDKNPQNVEVATAVFQRLQTERKKVVS